MARFPEADARIFENVYICMKCNAKNRVDKRRIRLGKAKCRECNYTRLRPKRKEH
jgi:ribosomal protein L40E